MINATDIDIGNYSTYFLLMKLNFKKASISQTEGPVLSGIMAITPK